MQHGTDHTTKILLSTEEEVFQTLITADDPFRRLNALLNFTEIVEPLRGLSSDLGSTGIDVAKGFKALLVQFWEDYSDRQMEKALRHNIALKWFCGFSLTEPTPDHSYFGKLRDRIGASELSHVFTQINATLKARGLFGNVFTFIDASAIVTKTALWKERDRAIKDGEETLNNAMVAKYAVDTDARWGAKGKDKIWFGYKQHVAVDMRYGLIEKTMVTPANVLDFQVVDQICPEQRMVFMDKLFDCQQADRALRAHRCASATIRKNNNKQKNPDLDRWRSRIRMPFESVFSKLERRARYRGEIKVLFQVFCEAIVHNLKRTVSVLARAPVMA